MGSSIKMRHNHNMADLQSVQERITTLSDEKAVVVLRLVVEHDRLPVPVDDWDSAHDHLDEALTVADLAPYAPDNVHSYSGSDVARAALRYRADSSDDAAALVDQAISYASGPGERFEPVTLALGAIVLAILQTDLKLSRDADGHWSFQLHKKALRDSTLGHVLTAFIGHFGNSGN